ncbi:MAG: methyltransferase domain-containing protein [Proteobacteria bacterium]|nr:methyltransferase domain-containing protein [Pseudomonadota bacterium]
MLDLTRDPAADPLRLYRYRDGIYAVDLVNAAIVHLDFFTWLATHPSDKATICRELQLSERPVDVMLTLFAANGFIRAEQGIFHVTEVAREHLVAGSPWFLGPYFASLKDRPVALDMVKVLRSGKPANWGSSKSEKEWSKAMEEPDFAQRFTAAMDCRGIYLGRAVAKALDLRGRARLLDIAGGSGIYACAITAAHPHLRATVFEKSPVDQVAAKLITERGHADKVSVLAGDMFSEALPAGFDVHLFSNVLHDWDTPVVAQLLAKSYAALPPGGLLVIHDMHVNADKTGPLPVAEYSVILMHSTEGKCYSLGELDELFQAIGFRDLKHTPTAADRSIVTAVKPG